MTRTSHPLRRDVPRVAGIALQWLRFATVGASNTLLSWCLYVALQRVGVPYLLASGLAFAAGALNSYAFNRRWTFRSSARRAPEIARFGVVQCVGLALDVGLLYVLVHAAGVHHLVAQALVFPVASAATFALSRRWAFASRRTCDSPSPRRSAPTRAGTRAARRRAAPAPPPG